MKKLIFIVGLLFACTPAPTVKIENIRTKIQLEVVLFGSERALNKHIYDNFPVSKDTREGFSMWYEDGNDCTLYLVEVGHYPDKKALSNEANKQLPIYGHELMHCIYGSYHSE